VSKVGEGKFVASVENKPLKKYSTKSMVEGTAPAQPSDKPVQVSDSAAPPADAKAKPASNPIVSPLDEMNSQPAAPAEKTKPAKGGKKPVKVARN
jgi:hypothetical protein